jgi:hypothetical protein
MSELAYDGFVTGALASQNVYLEKTLPPAIANGVLVCPERSRMQHVLSM